MSLMGIVTGLGIAGSALVIKAVHSSPLTKQLRKHAERTYKRITSLDNKYYRGGFEAKMSKREANLILGLPQSATKKTIATAHRRVMILNHPDKGGSPYLAAKINEAKDMLR